MLIGIDPPKATNAVAAVDEGGKLIELATFATNRAGLRLLEQWGKRYEKRRWAVEGAVIRCAASMAFNALMVASLTLPP